MLYYSFALDNSDNLINIKDATKGEEYHCPCCGKVMICKKGNVRKWHFAHKGNLDNCSYETYLHKIAKIKIWNMIKTERCFYLELNREILSKCSNCDLGFVTLCSVQTYDKVRYNLCEYYDVYSIEKKHHKYIADILLTNSSQPQRIPIFIEICVHHKCSSDKYQSGFKIIEIYIESEFDVDTILNHKGLTGFSNFKTFGFKSSLMKELKNRELYCYAPLKDYGYTKNPLRWNCEKYKYIDKSIRNIDDELQYVFLSKVELSMQEQLSLSYLCCHNTEMLRCWMCYYYCPHDKYHPYRPTCSYNLIHMVEKFPSIEDALYCKYFLFKYGYFHTGEKEVLIIDLSGSSPDKSTLCKHIINI